MADIEVYSSRFCPYCSAALRLLEAKGVAYRVHQVDFNGALRREMMDRCGRHTVPQVFIGGRSLGGFDDLAALDAVGELDPLLANGSTPAPDESP